MKITVKNSGVIKLTTKKHPRHGHLFVAEAARHIPFLIRRIYFINNIKKYSCRRGNHAHKKLKQAMFCLNGSFVLSLDDGRKKQKLILKNPETGVILGPRLWHSMSKFSKHCVILVLASNYYKESDYIRDYNDFLEITKRK